MTSDAAYAKLKAYVLAKRGTDWTVFSKLSWPRAEVGGYQLVSTHVTWEAADRARTRKQRARSK